MPRAHKIFQTFIKVRIHFYIFSLLKAFQSVLSTAGGRDVLLCAESATSTTPAKPQGARGRGTFVKVGARFPASGCSESLPLPVRRFLLLKTFLLHETKWRMVL